MRSPATSGGTLTGGVGPGGAPTVAASATSQASWTAASRYRLVDLEAAVDDVQEDGLAGHEIEGMAGDVVLAIKFTSVALRSPLHDSWGRGRRARLAGRDHSDRDPDEACQDAADANVT